MAPAAHTGPTQGPGMVIGGQVVTMPGSPGQMVAVPMPQMPQMLFCKNEKSNSIENKTKYKNDTHLSDGYMYPCEVFRKRLQLCKVKAK